jgi:hypothetical protein
MTPLYNQINHAIWKQSHDFIKHEMKNHVILQVANKIETDMIRYLGPIKRMIRGKIQK